MFAKLLVGVPPDACYPIRMSTARGTYRSDGWSPRRHCAVDHGRRLRLRLRWRIRPDLFGEPAPARPNTADPALLRLPGLGGALLVHRGDGGVDGGGGERLLRLLLRGGQCQRGEPAPIRRTIRTVRVRARVRPGQGEQEVRAPRRKGHPDLPSRAWHRRLYLDTSGYQAYALPLAVLDLHYLGQLLVQRGARWPGLGSRLPVDARGAIRGDYRVCGSGRCSGRDYLVYLAPLAGSRIIETSPT